MADESLYLLQDGTYASPGDCARGDDGVLRHANGVGVALKDDGTPHTLCDTARANREAIEASKQPGRSADAATQTEDASAERKQAPVETKEMKPGEAGGAPYVTRETKAE